MGAVLVLLLAISGFLIVGVHVGSIEVKSWECNTFEYPAHDVKRILVGVLLQELAESKIPYWKVHALGTSVPRRHPAIYGYANCSAGDPWFDSDKCVRCLRLAKRSILRNCPHRFGAKVYLDLCYMRYEDYFF
ncbi:hypothetical protein LINGRAHAP2_LOCUS17636 [Linum grandiflorum]